MAGVTTTVQGYAQALLAVAQAEGVLDRVQDELYAFAAAVERHASSARRSPTPRSHPSGRRP